MENIKEQIKKKEKELSELKAKLESQEVLFDNGKIKIIKWENKKWGDFHMPKDWDFCKFSDFIELYDSGKFKLEGWKYYAVKHFSKKVQKGNYPLSRLCLDWVSFLYSNNEVLASSYSNGRVVIQKQ